MVKKASIKNNTKSNDDSIHVTDEKINSITHLFALIIFVPLSVLLIIESNNAWEYVGYSIYATGVIMLFLFSTLHHSIKNKTLQILDYCSVFLLIAGTFTAFAFMLRTPTAFVIFGTVWLFSIIGITLKLLIKISKYFTNTMYITLGWLAVFLAIPLYEIVNLTSVILLGLGGIVYSIGFTVYCLEKPNLIKGKFGFHEIWHILVIIAAFLHWLALYLA
ncbi:MAG: PAQR family membrane homeostasis protein TrhA [Candidatus Woesearchaeota archaeon]